MSTPEKYNALDDPTILEYLFHPRKEGLHRSLGEGRDDFMIPVADGVSLGASLHYSDPGAPVILFFHGNGEIVSDYDELGQAFTRGAGVNFFVVDYRGYGASSGSPSASAMISDAHVVLAFVRAVMAERKMTGNLSVMGRSLGSAPALELAARSSFEFHCLIVESGFALAGPLLRVLGLNPEIFGFKGLPGDENLDKMAQVICPCLVIHAQFDHLIPFSDGQALYEGCPAEKKYLLEIKGANHNDIFIRGMAPYLEQVRIFC